MMEKVMTVHSNESYIGKVIK